MVNNINNKTFRLLASFFAILFVVSCAPEQIPDSPYSYEQRSVRPTTSQPAKEPVTLSQQELSEGPIVVAILLPLSGASENTGKAMLDAASLALFRSYDPRIQLLPFDTLGTSDGADRATKEALDAGASIIIGPLFSEASFAAANLARRANVPMISFSNNKNIAGDGVYLLSFMPDEEVRQVVKYASHQGMKRFAALIPEGPYGEIVLDSFSQAVSQWNGEITALEIYPPTADGVFQPVRRLADYEKRRRAFVREEQFLEGLGGGMAEDILKTMENLETIGDVPFDAVLVPEGGELLRNLIPLLPFFEVDPAKIKFLGTGLWDDRSLIHEPPMKGAWYASSAPQKTDAFYVEFEEVFAYQPPRIATLAYDAISMVATLARNEISQQRFAHEAFLNSNGFLGVDGIFRFKESGVTERRLAIVEITPNGFRTIQDMPESFEN